MSNGDEDLRVREYTACRRTKRRAEKIVSINLPQVHPRIARSPISSFSPTIRAHHPGGPCHFCRRRPYASVQATILLMKSSRTDLISIQTTGPSPVERTAVADEGMTG